MLAPPPETPVRRWPDDETTMPTDGELLTGGHIRCTRRVNLVDVQAIFGLQIFMNLVVWGQ